MGATSGEAGREGHGPGGDRGTLESLHEHRIHKVLEHIDPARVYLSTDCGLKALPRFCAYEKLRALSRAAKTVRAELGG